MAREYRRSEKEEDRIIEEGNRTLFHSLKPREEEIHEGIEKNKKRHLLHKRLFFAVQSRSAPFLLHRRKCSILLK
jgi:hypothetical protein